MTTYILHGSFTRIDNDSNRSFFAEFLKDVQDNGKVLLVFFAAKDDRVDSLCIEITKLCRGQLNGKQVTFTQATIEGFEAQLEESDAVYLHGGNTPTLISVLKNYQNLKEKFAGKTIAGSSAGAYALATYGAAHTEEHIRIGLGILPIRLVCHFESPELPPSETSLIKIVQADQSLELIYIRDYEWKSIEG